ncbi:PepSY-associated TM helix domain-containing protein [Marinobacterium sp. AK62]|uniref:PepSY-associated TM helix domain-containing protein n=1 Tax=Marinobacterium alkalitolerans TaxID=1542925 RepID=A0ABS3ZAM3_9GAMM|nr:PepSY-associated TM helix domain-containing protein [Marinobacterium alkalitolerans]MBP0048747.1 PepSY-associated TM helix domain-containing protein [Marinobacterium alkalitolerans]
MERTEIRSTETREAGPSRAKWLRRLLTWHWISSALALFGMLLFAITGFTLNHAGQIAAEPQVTTLAQTVPAPVLKALQVSRSKEAALPRELRVWMQRQQGIHLPAGPAEWSEYEVYLAMPRPGGDAWISVELDTGALLYESTDRGWIAYLNDLHKGRHTGAAWRLFIDVFALVCVVFSLTGLAVLWLHARERTGVWPVTGLGILVPLLLAILMVH